MSNPILRIGTRKSALALAQAEEVRARLAAAWPELAVHGAMELVPMTTSGDRFLDQKLADIGGKGLFTKELEEGLLAGSLDIAVHSMKDMATTLPDGLIIGAMLPREDPRDMLIGHHITSIEALPQQGRIGTSSLRRSSLLLLQRPDLEIVALRGNVQTRLAKLEAGTMDATILAMAGLNRLGLRNIPGVVLDPGHFIPAVAQGAIGIECRHGDDTILRWLKPLMDPDTIRAVTCERAFLRVLDGSCRTPIAGYAQIQGNQLRFSGLIARPDGSRHHRIEIEGAANEAEPLGQEAGEKLKLQAGPDFLS